MIIATTAQPVAISRTVEATTTPLVAVSPARQIEIIVAGLAAKILDPRTGNVIGTDNERKFRKTVADLVAGVNALLGGIDDTVALQVAGGMITIKPGLIDGESDILDRIDFIGKANVISIG